MTVGGINKFSCHVPSLRLYNFLVFENQIVQLRVLLSIYEEYHLTCSYFPYYVLFLRSDLRRDFVDKGIPCCYDMFDGGFLGG